MNYDKIQAFSISPHRVNTFQFIMKKTLAWTEEPVKILGCWIHRDMALAMMLNTESVLRKAKQTLEKWTNRNLSWMGKISVINSLIVSLFSYQLAVLPFPSSSFFQKYKQIVLEFLWGTAPSKISYAKIIQNYENGGLKFIDLPSKIVALKAKWPLYFANRDEPWLYRGSLDHSKYA